MAQYFFRAWLKSALVCLALFACSEPSAVPDAESTYPSLVSSLAEFDALATDGGELKFWLPTDDSLFGNLPCVFQDSTAHPLHLDFLQGIAAYATVDFETYRSWTASSVSRRAWVGTIRRVATADGVRFAYTLSPGLTPFDHPQIQDVIAAHDTLKGCAPALASALRFEASDWSVSLADAFHDVLKDAGVSVVNPDTYTLSGPTAYSPGMRSGWLRVIDPGESFVGIGLDDIVLAESLPVDLPLVAGAVTSLPQSALSHLNVRLLERGHPNGAVPGALQRDGWRALEGEWVVLRVADGAIDLAASQASPGPRQPGSPTVPSANLDQTTLMSFESMRLTDCDAYGGKACGLGELTQALPSPHHTRGFGIPFSFYADFVTQNSLDEDIQAVVDDMDAANSAVVLSARLKSLRKAFKKAPIPASLLPLLQTRLVELFGDDVLTHRVRFRSSANLEDLAGYSGAGLYDSASGCLADDLDDDDDGPSHCLHPDERADIEARLEAWRARFESTDEDWIEDIIEDLEDDLTEEKTVTTAIRKVWSSAYTAAAWLDRQGLGLDQHSVLMGVAVNRSFVLERVNAVAVTDTAGASSQVLSQPGFESVVKPNDPASVPEHLTLSTNRDGAVETTIEHYSTLDPHQAGLWPDPSVLAPLLDQAATHFSMLAPSVTRWQFELKLDRHGTITFKQARPHEVP